MKQSTVKSWACVSLLAAACAHSGERASARAPSSAEAEEAPARSIATSLASDPVNEPGPEQAQPEHHHGMQHALAAEPQAEPTVYTCPMHPEVQQAGPGACPKCGMKLVPSTKPAPHSQPEPAHQHAN